MNQPRDNFKSHPSLLATQPDALARIADGPGGGAAPISTSIKLPLLITGIAGVAGYNAFHAFREKFGDQVIGLRPVKNWPLRGPGIVGCDIENTDDLKALLERYQIKSVLNCGGSCALKSCELDPAMAHRVNVDGIANLLGAIKATDVALVHLSIDLVFSGVGEGGYVETDTPDPVTVYGKTMVKAERLIQERRPESCILRISLPMGISFNGHAGAIDWIQSRFAKHKPATLYFDEVRTPTYVQCLNETIEEVFARNITGLYHAGGPVKLSLYQIAQIVNRVGGYRPELLIGCPRIDAGPMPPRAGNVTMDSSKLARRLGRPPFQPWPLKPEHLPTSQSWHCLREPDAEASLDAIVEQLYRRPVSRSWIGNNSGARLFGLKGPREK